MVGFLNKFKALYADSLRVKSLVFAASASAVISGIYGWSLFQQDYSEVSSHKYQYISKTKGSRGSHPKYFVQSAEGYNLSMQDWVINCFYKMEFGVELYIQFVEFDNTNVVVACSREKVRLDASNGLEAVRRSLRFRQLLAKSAVVVLFLSLGGLFSLRKIRLLFGW